MSATPYDERYYRSREAWLDFRLEVQALLRLSRLSATSSVLDVGCGSGELLRAAGSISRLAAGVDLSQLGLKIAAARAPVASARAEVLPFEDACFDVIVSQHVFEHLGHPALALAEWRRVLRPGGRVVLVTPNGAYPDRAHFEDATHVRLFTPASLRHALEDAGYRLEELFTLFPYLGPGRLARAASIRLANVARLLPPFAATGRSIVASARVA